MLGSSIICLFLREKIQFSLGLTNEPAFYIKPIQNHNENHIVWKGFHTNRPLFVLQLKDSGSHLTGPAPGLQTPWYF